MLFKIFFIDGTSKKKNIVRYKKIVFIWPISFLFCHLRFSSCRLSVVRSFFCNVFFLKEWSYFLIVNIHTKGIQKLMRTKSLGRKTSFRLRGKWNIGVPVYHDVIWKYHLCHVLSSIFIHIKISSCFNYLSEIKFFWK